MHTGRKAGYSWKNTLAGKLKKKLLGGSNRHFTESDMYHPEIFDLEDAYLSGFWACEAYYADILPMLRSQIHFRIRKGRRLGFRGCREK